MYAAINEAKYGSSLSTSTFVMSFTFKEFVHFMLRGSVANKKLSSLLTKILKWFGLNGSSPLPSSKFLTVSLGSVGSQILDGPQ